MHINKALDEFGARLLEYTEDVAHCTAVGEHTLRLSDEWSYRCKTGETCQVDNTDSLEVLQVFPNVDVRPFFDGRTRGFDLSSPFRKTS